MLATSVNKCVSSFLSRLPDILSNYVKTIFTRVYNICMGLEYYEFLVFSVVCACTNSNFALCSQE